MNYLLTGTAGLWNTMLLRKLLKRKKVFGLDNLNNYYDINLKKEIKTFKKI